MDTRVVSDQALEATWCRPCVEELPHIKAQCLTATNAGHPRPIWYCTETQAWTVLKDQDRALGQKTPSNLPLGVIDCSEYDQVMVRLAPGDVLLFYTDSITEARDSDGGMLREQGLMELLRQLDTTRPHELVQQVVDQVGRFRGGREAEDDLTVVAMVCSGEKPGRHMTEKMGAMALIGRAIIARLLGKRAPVPWPEMSMVSILGMFIRPVNRLWGGGLRPGEVRTGAAARRADR